MYIESDSPINVGGNNGYGNGSFLGSDGLWALLIFAMIFNGGFGGFGGGNNMLYDINANTNRGFDNLALNSGIDSLQTAVSNGFANAQVQNCNSTASIINAVNTLGVAQQAGIYEGRLGIADLKSTIVSENCADRQALNEGVRDIIASNTANTQAILDKLCQQELDAKNDLIATLRSQLSMADLKASQAAQTAAIKEGQVAEIDALYNRLSNCPVPSTPVYGRVPIFTCNGMGGCGSIQ